MSSIMTSPSRKIHKAHSADVIIILLWHDNNIMFLSLTHSASETNNNDIAQSVVIYI